MSLELFSPYLGKKYSKFCKKRLTGPVYPDFRAQLLKVGFDQDHWGLLRTAKELSRKPLIAFKL